MRSVAVGVRFSWLICLVAYASVGVATLLPTGEVVDLDFAFGVDKIMHAVAWAVLACAAWLVCRTWWTRVARTALAVWLVTLAYGALVEALQLAVPGRTAEWGDLAADAVGASIAVALLSWRRIRADRSG